MLLAFSDNRVITMPSDITGFVVRGLTSSSSPQALARDHVRLEQWFSATVSRLSALEPSEMWIANNLLQIIKY